MRGFFVFPIQDERSRVTNSSPIRTGVWMVGVVHGFAGPRGRNSGKRAGRDSWMSHIEHCSWITRRLLDFVRRILLLFEAADTFYCRWCVAEVADSFEAIGKVIIVALHPLFVFLADIFFFFKYFWSVCKCAHNNFKLIDQKVSLRKIIEVRIFFCNNLQNDKTVFFNNTFWLFNLKFFRVFCTRFENIWIKNFS